MPPELALVILVFWLVFWLAGHTQVEDPSTRTRRATSGPPPPLATRNPRGYSVTVPSHHVPVYQRSVELRQHAVQLAESVRLGKLAIAAHREAIGLDNKKHPDWCTIEAIIAGVARDRKTLKKLEYDQPF